MPLEKITTVSGQGVYVPGDDIDTDRIIPARFMKCVTFDGLGEYLFYDVRHDSNDKLTEHALNDPNFSNASIMLSGMNFGCGSSREHAPQSLYRAGFRAIIAGNFAEIFFGNSINLGMPCVSLDEEERSKLATMIESHPELELKINLAAKEILAGDINFTFEIREGARESLMNGKWDPIDELLSNGSSIEKVANSLSYS
jgi:3-isopropylmalate/(R)-2-methylmalate dehydratase small subunit